MMSYDQWLGKIVNAAQNIASREFQEEAWFPGGKFVSSPIEVYECLMEDSTPELFFEKYAKTFTESQMQCWSELKSQLQHYYDKLPNHPDPSRVLYGPEWDLVRQAAAGFVREFGQRATR
jgi:hypothetical protein